MTVVQSNDKTNFKKNAAFSLVMKKGLQGCLWDHHLQGDP